jgi:uncharacterized protein (TIGR00661 family)
MELRFSTQRVLKIFYGICGEGLGHSGRSIALVERLTALGHRITIFTFADALAALAKAGYLPHRIAGLQFGVTASGGVSTVGTAGNFCRYLHTRRESLDMIRQLALAEQPDLCITDFEPLVALAAESLGVPCVSVDNQHRFCEPLGRGFSLRLQVYSRLAGQFVRRWIKRPRQSIVAVFHQCPPSPHYQRVEALVRDRIARLEPTGGDHLLLYAKGPLGRRMLEVASTVRARFIAYGANGAGAPNIAFKPTDYDHTVVRGSPDPAPNVARSGDRPQLRAANIAFKPTDYDQFAADLASCRGVLCSAGQQLISEAHYFGKPLLVVPMPGQHEQEINARFARQEAIGDWSSITELSRERIEKCFDRHFTAERPANGVDQVLDLLGIGHG